MYVNYDIDWIKKLREKNLYVFGAGETGIKTYYQLLAEGLKVFAYIDNDYKKVGTTVENLPILSFDSFKNNLKENDFVVIASKYSSEIKSQLIDSDFFKFVDKSQIDFTGNGEKHYNKQYFEWQREVAKVDSVLDVDFFQPYIKMTDNICEFGCGGGLLLEKIKCNSKVGVDINPVAREYAHKLGIKTVENVTELEDESYDVFISTHALEHTLTPFEILINIKNKLKVGGIAVFVVPYDSVLEEYIRDDVSHHVFTWNQRDLGNLFKAAGFFVKEVGIKESVWPDNWKGIYEEVGKNTFKSLAILESARTANYSCYVVAEKS